MIAPIIGWLGSFFRARPKPAPAPPLKPLDPAEEQTLKTLRQRREVAAEKEAERGEV